MYCRWYKEHAACFSPRGTVRFRFMLKRGTNLYTMKTNLHPFQQEWCSIRTIRALDKKRLTKDINRKI